MKKIIALTLGLASTLSSADSHFGMNYAPLDYSGLFTESNPKALVFSFGTELNHILELQGRYGLQLRDDSGFPVELENLYGAYLLVNLPLESNFKPYALFGFTELYLKSNYELESESDFSFGVGFDYKFNEHSAVNVEYTSYLAKADEEVTSLSIGYKYHF